MPVNIPSLATIVTFPEVTRWQIIEEYFAYVRTRGIEPHPEVVALYGRYALGELSWLEVSELMRQRWLLLYQDLKVLRELVPRDCDGFPTLAY